MKIKKLFQNKKFKHGSLATAITAIFIAIIVVVNIVVALLIDRFDWKIDLTANQIYQVTDQTEEYLKNYNEKVTIYVLEEEEAFKTYSDLYTQAYYIIEKFASLNSNITTEYINLTEHPDFATNYPDVELVNGDLLLVGENGRYQALTGDDLFTQSYSDDYQTSEVLSMAEQSIDSALAYIVGEDPVNVAMISGHEEIDLSSIQDVFEKSNYNFNSVSLLTGTIPDDTDMVLIACPSVDYTVDEIAKLDAFLDNNGQLGKTVTYFGSASQGTLPNLEAFLSKWGIQVQDGAIHELDSNMIYQNSLTPFTTVNANDYTSNMPNTSTNILTPYLKPMQEGKADSGITVTTLATTGETCVRQPADADANWQPTNDELQSYAVALAAKKTSGENSSQVVAYASVDMLAFLSEPVVNNGDFVLATFNAAANRENTIQITPKSLTASTLGISSFQGWLLLILFVIIVPVAVLITGLAVWMRRRHR
ncbi:GldG family protein [Clostridium facile]|uniref:GldG family protein n=1 Tax=Clostridium facile TaxID=2763035 RepID=A0ABR7ISW1_9CLOT|nr:GldG family protein [Clostridium facile]MBC5788225.1 GldG family protein [Clostridium facile]